MSSSNQSDPRFDELTPPREFDEDEEDTFSSGKRRRGGEQHIFSPPVDYNNASDVFKLLQARLQYAQIKLETGLSTENLQQIERSFITSPRQPRRPLPSEYPPTPQSSTPQSRKMKRLLLSAMTPTQNSWRKKKKMRQQLHEDNTDQLEEEDAARTILMLGSSQQGSPSNRPTHKFSTNILQESSSSTQEFRIRRRPSAYYSDNDYKEDTQEEEDGDEYYEQSPSEQQHHPDLFGAIAEIPNYEEKSRQFAKSLLERRESHQSEEDQEQDSPTTNSSPSKLPPKLPPTLPPPPAIVSGYDNVSGSTYQYYQYDRPLPPPPPYFNKNTQPPFIFERTSNSQQPRSNTRAESLSPSSPPHN